MVYCWTVVADDGLGRWWIEGGRPKALKPFWGEGAPLCGSCLSGFSVEVSSWLRLLLFLLMRSRNVLETQMLLLSVLHVLNHPPITTASPVDT